MPGDGGWSFVGDWGQPSELDTMSSMIEPVLASDLFAAALSKSSSSSTPTAIATATPTATSEYPHKSAYKKTISCPDFSVFTAEAFGQDAEQQNNNINNMNNTTAFGTLDTAEMKRDRRLARNRASARLRRQRKRSTIETLEHKIEKLNLRIETLQSYSFGSGLERGSGLSSDIGSRNHTLSQPKEDKRMESTKYYLDNACRDMKILLNNQVFAALMNSVTGPDESTAERRTLQQELRDVLELTESQKQTLNQVLTAKNHVAHQYTTMCALLHCAMVGIENDWFSSVLHSRVTDAFLTSVTGEQNKRYMNWADRNTEAISMLNCYRPTEHDKIHADPVEQAYWPPVEPKTGKPIFYFGGKGSGKLCYSLWWWWWWWWWSW